MHLQHTCWEKLLSADIGEGVHSELTYIDGLPLSNHTRVILQTINTQTRKQPTNSNTIQVSLCAQQKCISRSVLWQATLPPQLRTQAISPQRLSLVEHLINLSYTGAPGHWAWMYGGVAHSWKTTSNHYRSQPRNTGWLPVNVRQPWRCFLVQKASVLKLPLQVLHCIWRLLPGLPSLHLLCSLFQYCSVIAVL